MAERHYVIIGNGPAGYYAALTLRQKAPFARITIVSKTWESCYSPHKLPALIAGKIGEKDLYISSFESYQANNIKLRCCQAVVELNLENREIILEHKEVIRFDGCIIAVGGMPHIPEPFLAFKDDLVTLKSLEDARTWLARLSDVDSVLLLGGGITALPILKTLHHLDIKTMFMLDQHGVRSFSRCAPASEADVKKRLDGLGVKILEYSKIQDIVAQSNGSCVVHFADFSVDVDMIGAFFGLVPNVSFLSGSGLRIDQGNLSRRPGPPAQTQVPHSRPPEHRSRHRRILQSTITCLPPFFGMRDRYPPNFSDVNR